MIELNEIDQEAIGKCAEKNAPDCQMNLGDLCEGCSIYRDNKGDEDRVE